MNTINGLFRKEVLLNALSDGERQSLLEKLTNFAGRYYRIDDPPKFVEQVLQPNLQGILAQYSVAEECLGFTRLTCQKISIAEGNFTVFWGSTWHNQNYPLTHTAARFALMHALKYKLFHPQENLIYLATANSPQRYTYLKKLATDSNGEIFAKDTIAGIIQSIAKKNKWHMDPENPFIVQQDFPLLAYPQQEWDANEDFSDLNPGHSFGHWLMVYLPLDMQSIGQCLKRSVNEAVSY